MKIRYLFLDDAASSDAKADEDLGPLVDNIEYGRSDLKIEVTYPGQFDDQLSELRSAEIDGLILDLRLDEFAPSNQNKSREKKPNYRATAFAQEIRTRATERNFEEFPIILWSYERKLKKSYTKDDTGHDLFDLKCKKEDLQELNSARIIGDKLIALAQGYKEIKEIRSRKGGPGTQFYKFLGFEEDPGFLDPRLLAYFEGKDSPIPAHEYARFIIKQILDTAGPLIKEDLLAARLGIDIQASDGWAKLKDTLPQEMRYKGPFRQGWPRWWAYHLEVWWENLEGCPGPLRRLEADDRVEFLKRSLRLNDLVAARPIADHYSTRYWTVCQGSEAPRSETPRDPLDPLDGFVVDRKDKQPWQDELYISEKRALEGSKLEEGLRVDPLERERFRSLKERLKQQEQ